MITYPIVDKNKGPGHFAFEVENAYVLPRRIARILAEIDGVTDVQLPSSRATDTRVEFKYRGRDYMVWEPYGDSSRYWIGPQDDEDQTTDISIVEDEFKRYRPPLYHRVIGDMLTLRMVKRLVGRG